MKFYRVNFWSTHEASLGFEFFSSLSEAEAALSQFKKDHEDAEGSTIEVVIVEQTKKGILQALNKYGRHPDNG